MRVDRVLLFRVRHPAPILAASGGQCAQVNIFDSQTGLGMFPSAVRWSLLIGKRACHLVWALQANKGLAKLGASMVLRAGRTHKVSILDRCEAFAYRTGSPFVFDVPGKPRRSQAMCRSCHWQNKNLTSNMSRWTIR